MGNKSSLILEDEEIRQISEETGFSAQQIEKFHSRFSQLDRGHHGALRKGDFLSIPEFAINPLCDRLIEIFFLDASPKIISASRLSELSDAEEPLINFRAFMRTLAAFSSTPGSSLSAISQYNARDKYNDNFFDDGESQDPKRGWRRSKEEGKLYAQQSDNITDTMTATTTRMATMSTTTTAPSIVNGNSGSRQKINVNPMSDYLRHRLLFVFKIYDVDNDGRISFSDLRVILKLMVGNHIGDVQLDRITTRAFVEVDRDNDGFIDFREFCEVFAGKDMEVFNFSV